MQHKKETVSFVALWTVCKLRAVFRLVRWVSHQESWLDNERKTGTHKETDKRCWRWLCEGGPHCVRLVCCFSLTKRVFWRESLEESLSKRIYWKASKRDAHPKDNILTACSLWHMTIRISHMWSCWLNNCSRNQLGDHRIAFFCLPLPLAIQGGLIRLMLIGSSHCSIWSVYRIQQNPTDDRKRYTSQTSRYYDHPMRASDADIIQNPFYELINWKFSH